VSINKGQLQKIYDSLREDAVSYYKSGQVHTDPCLNDKARDNRRGLTVIARIDKSVSDSIRKLIDALKRVVPGQYYYSIEELHCTVLSLFTATEDYTPYFENLKHFISAVDKSLRAQERFSIEFSGVTASRGAVMVQGFPQGPHLGTIRERLRNELMERGLAKDLDSRYAARTAHATVMRYKKQPVDIGRLIDALSKLRNTSFGTTQVTRLFLVKNDWYMSKDIVEIVAAYPLK
jgi:2'-5' RNA ligase